MCVLYCSSIVHRPDPLSDCMLSVNLLCKCDLHEYWLYNAYISWLIWWWNLLNFEEDSQVFINSLSLESSQNRLLFWSHNQVLSLKDSRILWLSTTWFHSISLRIEEEFWASKVRVQNFNFFVNFSKILNPQNSRNLECFN